MSTAKYIKSDGERVPLLSPGDFSVTEVGAPKKVYFGTNKGNVYLPDKEGVRSIIEDQTRESYNRIFVNAMNDTGIEDGTTAHPYSTLSAAVIAMAAMTSATGFSLDIAYGTYTEASAITLPNKPMLVNGNNSTVTFTGGITVPNSLFTRRDLNTIGSVAFTSASSGRVLIEGGSITGNISCAGLTDFKSCSLLGGVITVASTSQTLIIACTMTSTISSAGILLCEQANYNTGKTVPLIASTGGFIVIVNCILINTSTGGCISCNNGADGTTSSNYISNNIIMAGTYASPAVPIASGTAYVVFVKNMVPWGTSTGSVYLGAADIIGVGTTTVLGSDATGDIYYRNAAGLLTRLPIGTSGQTLKVSAGGLPAWTT